MSSDEFESLDRPVFDMSSCPPQIPVGKRKYVASDSEDDLFTIQSKPKKISKVSTASAKPNMKSSCLENLPDNPSSSVNRLHAPKHKPKFLPKSKQTELVPSFANSLASENNTATRPRQSVPNSWS